MFVRNGQALGSVLHSAAPRADRPTPKKRGRPRKETVPEPEKVETPESEEVFVAPKFDFDFMKEPTKTKEKSDGGDTSTP